MNYEGKTFLILGGSSGIGLATAQKLDQLNAKLILVSRNQEHLKAAIDTLSGEGHLFFPCDITKLEKIGEIFDFIKSKGIRLDGMVHSAGISPLCTVKDNTVELMEHVFRVNFFSFVELVKYFQLEENSFENSKIVAISSITARGAGYRQTLYGASKAAMISSVKLMAKELLNRNIHINCISPGVTETPMVADLRSKSERFDDTVKVNQPLGLIPANTIAEAVAFLLSDISCFMTGTEWVLDGGASLK